MALTDTLIKFRSGTSEQYKALIPKDANTLYFLTDTFQLYKGDQLYGKSFEVVDAFPATGVDGVLYVSKNKAIKYYNSGAWIDALVPDTEIAADSTSENVVTSKAVAAFVLSEISKLTGGTSNAFVTSVEEDSETVGSIVVKKGTETTKVAIKLDGIVHNATYDSETRTITLPQFNGEDLVINLGKDLVVNSGAYDSEKQEIVLTLTSGDVVKVPVADLVNVYTASDDTTGAVQITVVGDTIKGSVIADGSTIKIVEGVLTADFSSLVTTATFEALKGTVDVHTGDITKLKEDVSDLSSTVSTLKTTVEGIPGSYVSSDTYSQHVTDMNVALGALRSDVESQLTWKPIV